MLGMGRARSCIWALGSWHQPLCSWQLQWLAMDKSFWHGWHPSQMATFLSQAIRPVVVLDHGKTLPIPSSPTKCCSAHQQGLSRAKCAPSTQWARAQWHRPPWHCSKCRDILRDSERLFERIIQICIFLSVSDYESTMVKTLTKVPQPIRIYTLSSMYSIHIYIYTYIYVWQRYLYICIHVCFYGVDAIL